MIEIHKNEDGKEYRNYFFNNKTSKKESDEAEQFIHSLKDVTTKTEIKVGDKVWRYKASASGWYWMCTASEGVVTKVTLRTIHFIDYFGELVIAYRGDYKTIMGIGEVLKVQI